MNVTATTVDLGGGVFWIGSCYDMGRKHHHISVYLLEREGNYLLIDSGPVINQTALIDEITRVTNGAGIDALVLTHQDLPHTGNVRAFRDEWEFDLYASFTGSSFSPRTLGMGDAIQCTAGEIIDFHGRDIEVTSPSPPLSDAGHEISLYDVDSESFFVADGFGHYHGQADCTTVWHSASMHVSVEDIAEYHLDSLPWIRFVDSEAVAAKIKQLTDSYTIQCLAPVHGNPIVGMESVALYLRRFDEAMRLIGNGRDFYTHSLE